MIKFDKVSFSYKEDVNLLNNITFSVNKGELISIVGESGCGKSTLLKLIIGLYSPTKGTIENDYSTISYMPQDGNLLPYLTIEENYKLHCKVLKIPYDKELVCTLSKDLNFDQQCLIKYPKELSGGQKQRASIINSLIIKPDCLILDEAFSALDPLTKLKSQNMLLKLHSLYKNLTILLVTHDVNESLMVSDKILYLNNKHNIGQFDNPTNIYMKPLSEDVKTYFHRNGEDCCINVNSWRVSALKKCELLDSDEIEVKDDNENTLFILRKDWIKDSLLKDTSSNYTLQEVYNKYSI